MNQDIDGRKGNVYGKQYPRHVKGVGDSGSFSRFCDLDAWFEKKLNELPEEVRKTFPFLIVSKASKGEKDCEIEEACSQWWNSSVIQGNA